MEKLSLKNILWIVFGVTCGYFAGQGMGTLLGTFVWIVIGVAFGGLVYYSTGTIVANTILSTTFGILFSLLAGALDRRFFGRRMSPAIWLGVGAALGAIVMFSYGINFITHPELYKGYQHLFPGSAGVAIPDSPELSPSFANMLRVAYGTGTGQLIGSYLGIFTGLLISIRETIGRKRKVEDKQEFDEYSNFFKERLKK